ncbi:cupin domain-containing protein [Roseateles noduli]|uniref:cupin domain-containing protein n=1 Tax=Roseateles noduli TaxID=2052484 RepID=UPI003D6526C9
MTLHTPSDAFFALASESDGLTPATRADFLSSVLSLVRLRGRSVMRVMLSDRKATSFSGPQSHFHIAGSGGLVLQFEEQRLNLSEGDVALVLAGASHDIAAASVAQPRGSDAESRDQAFTSKAQLISGAFDFEGLPLRTVWGALPNVIHLKASAGEAAGWLRAISSHLLEEAAQAKPGSALMISRLMELLVLRTLRAWLGKVCKTSGRPDWRFDRRSSTMWA